VPFDRAVIWDPQGGTFIDDLHFGPPIPAPPVAALLIGAAMAGARRRRRPWH
jgi:MYXO-CTERM domain-containing protein